MMKSLALSKVKLHRSLWCGARRQLCASSLNHIQSTDSYSLSSFREIGVSDSICSSLNKSNKTLATKIQELSFQPICEGKDVIIAAETGSGKTLAYAIPLMQNMLNGNLARVSKSYPSIVIAVPNKDLCRQVHNMIESVIPDEPGSITCQAFTNVSKHWPFPEDEDNSGKPLGHNADTTSSPSCPDIVICTPAWLSSFIKGPKLLVPGLFESVRVVVLDEADMLLEGSFRKDVERVMEALKVTRRRAIFEKKLKVHERMHQYVLAAATIPNSGTKSVERYISKHFKKMERISTNYLHRHHPLIEQTFVELPRSEVSIPSSPLNPQEAFDNTWPDRVDAVLAALFNNSPPESTSLPSHSPSADHHNNNDHNDDHNNNEEEDIDIIIDEPLAVPVQDPTMVFCNTAENASIMASLLRQRGIVCGEFHKLIPTDQRFEILSDFREGYIKVLVCTDAAARGLDIPSVKHVIQAEFALNVVNHLHRIGRASRGGTSGKATNIYDPSARDLVESIQSTMRKHQDTIVSGDYSMGEGGEGSTTGMMCGGEAAESEREREGSIDQSFSRRRGFRRTKKREEKLKEEGAAASTSSNSNSSVDEEGGASS